MLVCRSDSFPSVTGFMSLSVIFSAALYAIKANNLETLSERFDKPIRRFIAQSARDAEHSRSMHAHSSLVWEIRNQKTRNPEEATKNVLKPRAEIQFTTGDCPDARSLCPCECRQDGPFSAPSLGLKTNEE